MAGKKHNGWEKMRQARLERTKEKRAKLAQYQKERRERLKLEGICTQCATDKAIPGQTMCEKCKEIHNLKRKGVKQNYKSAKKYIITPEQKEKNAQRKKQKRIELKGLGICTVCAKVKALPGLTLCMSCRLAKNQARYGYVEHSQKWYEKERKAGRQYVI